MSPQRPRLIVGISGATGTVLAQRALEMLRAAGVESHVVITDAAQMTRAQETNLTADELRGLADYVYSNRDLAASLASGSFRTMGMLIVPCSVKTLGEIAAGICGNLLARAADVTLKERRRLVMVVRETPLSAIHLRNMLAITEAGGVIFPPVPAFYTKPATVQDIVDQTVARALSMLDIEVEELICWHPRRVNGVPKEDETMPA